MFFYFALFTICLVLSLIANKSNKPNVILFIVSSLIFIFFAYREGFTPDFYSYEANFTSKSVSERHDSELLYLFMVEHLPYQVGLIIQTILVCTAIYFAVRNVPVKYWWFCIFLLFFIRNFLLGNCGAFRSSFVTAAFFFALFFRDGTIKTLIIGASLILLSGLIHSSGWAMIVPYLLLSTKPINGRKYRLAFLVSFFIIVVSLFFIDSFNNTFNMLTEDIEELDAYRLESTKSTITIGSFTLLRLAMCFSLLFITLDKTKCDYGRFGNICIQATCFYILLQLIPGIGLSARFMYYFSFPVLVGSTTVIVNENNSSKKYLYMAAWLLFAVWEFYLFAVGENYKLSYQIYHNTLLGI